MPLFPEADTLAPGRVLALLDQPEVGQRGWAAGHWPAIKEGRCKIGAAPIGARHGAATATGAACRAMPSPD